MSEERKHKRRERVQAVEHYFYKEDARNLFWAMIAKYRRPVMDDLESKAVSSAYAEWRHNSDGRDLKDILPNTGFKRMTLGYGKSKDCVAIHAIIPLPDEIKVLLDPWSRKWGVVDEWAVYRGMVLLSQHYSNAGKDAIEKMLGLVEGLETVNRDERVIPEQVLEHMRMLEECVGPPLSGYSMLPRLAKPFEYKTVWLPLYKQTTKTEVPFYYVYRDRTKVLARARIQEEFSRKLTRYLDEVERELVGAKAEGNVMVLWSPAFAWLVRHSIPLTEGGQPETWQKIAEDVPHPAAFVQAKSNQIAKFIGWTGIKPVRGRDTH